MCYKAHTVAVISVNACYDEITVINAPATGALITVISS